jgi:hypothetical protein
MKCRQPAWPTDDRIVYCEEDFGHLGDHMGDGHSWHNDMPGAYPESR